MTTETEAELARKTSQLSTLSSQNERLVRTLKEAREQIVTLRAEIDRLAQPPSAYAQIVGVHDDGTVGASDIDLSVERGELVLLVGQVGSGKSSLLALASTLVTPDRGTVTIDATTEIGRAHV